jgi:hypothetical protein
MRRNALTCKLDADFAVASGVAPNSCSTGSVEVTSRLVNEKSRREAAAVIY